MAHGIDFALVFVGPAGKSFQEGQITGSIHFYNLVLSCLIHSSLFSNDQFILELIMCIDQFGRPFSPETPALGQRIGKQ